MSRSHPSSIEVLEFYDRFRDSRMIKYREGGNLRLEQAFRRVEHLVLSDSRVLEIGCGIGVVAERIARRLETGFLWACDLSPKNIEYARSTVDSKRVDFFTCDINGDFDSLRNRVARPVDVIILIDVLEHVPLQHHAELFLNLETISHGDTSLVLTFPSPQYQRYLSQHQPEELQIVDEVITLSHLHAIANPSGFVLKLYSLQDVWLRNQYVHCVFARNVSIAPVARQPPGMWGLVRRRLRRVLARLRLVPGDRPRFPAR